MIALPAHAGEMRIAGQAFATVDARGHVKAWTEGCAAFAADGVTCVRPLKADSLVRVASISKLVTAMGVMRLVEQGALDLDQDISRYLGHAVRNPAFVDTPLTLRLLLSHRSSLRDADNYALPLGATLKQALDDEGRWDAERAPGSYFHYDNINFVVVGTVMEAVTGERFDLLMKRLLLTPLGIHGCFNWASCRDADVTRAAVLYRTGPDETVWNPDGPWVAQVDDLKGQRPECAVRRAADTDSCDLAGYVPGTNGALFSPQGGLRISVKDLAKIAAVLAHGGRWGRVRLLKASTVDAMMAPQWVFDAQASNGDTEKGTMCAYGLGVHLLHHASGLGCRDDVFGDGRQRAGHLAEAYGLFGGLWVDIERKTASIYLVTGTSRDPKAEPGESSGFTRVEEMAARRVR